MPIKNFHTRVKDCQRSEKIGRLEIAGRVRNV